MATSDKTTTPPKGDIIKTTMNAKEARVLSFLNAQKEISYLNEQILEATQKGLIMIDIKYDNITDTGIAYLQDNGFDVGLLSDFVRILW